MVGFQIPTVVWFADQDIFAKLTSLEKKIFCSKRLNFLPFSAAGNEGSSQVLLAARSSLLAASMRRFTNDTFLHRPPPVPVEPAAAPVPVLVSISGAVCKWRHAKRGRSLCGAIKLRQIGVMTWQSLMRRVVQGWVLSRVEAESCNSP